MNNGTPIIEIRDLKKVYRVGEVDVQALRSATLTVNRGEFVSIIGPSGSGKSTLFYILGGLLKPTSGTVMLNGKNVAAVSDAERTRLRRDTVGFVFQKYNLLPTLDAADNIAIAQHIAGKKVGLDDEFRTLLDVLGVSKRMHHRPSALSGGEQQRIAIARALVNRPALLLADEPTGNLDTENSKIVLDLLRDLNRRLKQTILMITHNPEAAAYGDRIVEMRDGRILGERRTA